MTYHRSIVAAFRRCVAADEHYDATLKKVQATCRHPEVVQARFEEGTFLNRLPRRLCLHCGLVETAWNWGSTSYLEGQEGFPPTRLRTEFVRDVTQDELTNLMPHLSIRKDHQECSTSATSATA